MRQKKPSVVELSPNMQNLALRSDDFAGDEFDDYSETGIETSLKFKGQETEESYGGFDDYAPGI